MATLIAFADAVLTGAATWDVADATSLQETENSSTALTTSYVESAGFTPGAITIDGIAVKVANRAASPSGTISVRLAQAGATVAGTEVTINATDIEARQAEQGWYFFKFAAPVLLVVATAYTVSAKCSVNAEVTLYKGAAAGNWARMLRTTTTAVAGTGDNLHILGEWTAAATKTNRVVTMDQTAATDYGDNTAANPPQFTIGKGGTLTWGTTAATNYILRLSGRLAIYVGGTMTMGTVALPIPRDGSCEMQFDGGAADGDFGLVAFGTLTLQGQSRTAAKLFSQCLLNTDEAAAQTTLGVDTDTGWLSGDEIALAPTSRTNTEAEVRVLNGNAAATTIAVTAGLTSAHSGTSPTQAEVILLTRNCRIVSTSTTLMGFVTIGIAATLDADWCLFRYMGSTAATKRGVEVLTTSAGSASFTHCCIRDFDRWGLLIASNSADNITISHLVGYKVGHQSTGDIGVGHVSGITGMTTTNWSMTDVTIISNNNAAGSCVALRGLGGTVQRLRVSAGGGAGILIDLTNNETSPAGTLSDWNSHANGQSNMEIIRMYQGRIDTVRLWRSNTAATDAGLVLGRMGPVILNAFELFGNANNNILFDATNWLQVGMPLILRGAVVNGDSTFSTPTGLAFAANTSPHVVRLENCAFGVASGIKVTHTQRDIDLDPGATVHKYAELTLVDTVLASGTELSNSAQLKTNSVIRYQRVDGTTNVHKAVYPALGTIEYETSVFHTASPSEKLTPSGATATLRLRTRSRFKKADNAVAVDIGVWVRKSSLYTGSTVRLVVKANPAIGIDDDVVAASMTVAADAWEHLTYTTVAPSENGVVEYFVDCDGSAGIVYADDWT